MLAVLLLFVGVVISLQVPAVQTVITHRAARWVSDKMGFPVSIGHVSIKWFDALTLEKVSIRDRQQRPMIDVGRLDVNYNLQNLIDSSAHNLHLDEVVLYRPDVRLVKNPKTGDLNLDEFIARIDELTSDPKAPVSNSHVPFTIGKATIAEGRFTLEDPREPKMPSRADFDYNHFTLNNLNGTANNVLLQGDTIAIDIQKLKAIDRRSGLTIRRLDTKFLYCATQMELARLNLQVGNSVVRDYISLNYRKPADMGDFNRSVTVVAHFDGSHIQAKDLGYFASYLRTLNEAWDLTGNFRGTVNNFALTKTDLRFGPQGRSRLVGDLAFKGLPDMDQTTVNFALAPSSVNMADIRQYYPDASFNKIIQPLGTVQFDTRFVGAFDNFRTNGHFNTAVGKVTINDLVLKLSNKPANSTYMATIQADNFDLGKLLDEPAFGLLDGAGRIRGRGFSLATAHLDVDGKLNRFGVNGYNFRNVVVEGNLQQAFFNGKLSVSDPNLAFNLDGEFDLRGPQNRFDVRGVVRQADLRALGYIHDSLTISTALAVAVTGNTLDQLAGSAYFRNAFLSLNGRNLAIDTLAIESTILNKTAANRFVTIASDFLTARLEGNFTPVRTLDDLQQLLTEYKLYFAGHAAERAAYYTRKTERLAKLPLNRQPTRYSVDYQIGFRDARPLFDFLAPTAYIAPNAQLDGEFTVDRTTLLTANLKSDSLRWAGYRFGPTEVDITTSKFTNGEEVLASAIVTSQRQQLAQLAPTENLLVEAAWDIDHIEFASSIQQTASTNRARLNGELRFKGDAIDLTFQKSNLRVLDEEWTLNPQSLVRQVGREILFRDFSLTNQEQQITLWGRLSEDSSQVMNAVAKNFRLQTLDPVLNTKIGGTLNGIISLRDPYKTAILESELNIRALAYQGLLLGDVRAEGDWDPANQRLNITTRLNREGLDVLTMTGTYASRLTQSPLNLTAQFNDTELKLLEPFTTGLFSNLGGTIRGDVAITGPLKAPLLNGTVVVKRGKATFDYLKADLTFENNVDFRPGEISTKQLVLHDPNGNKATLHGGVFHDGFKYFQLNFDADFKNFRILNTTAKDNDQFYGTAVVTGQGELFGPLGNLTVRANVTSNKGTRMYIPLDGAQSVSSEDFIQFVNRSKASTSTDTPKTDSSAVDLSGIKMDFNLDVTPDAYCEIQLDRQTGDIIKAYGAGRIGMRIDTKGDFTMTGTYAIKQGEYTFTFQNVINKRFQIRPDSRITWTGDPYGALLDVTAAYTQYTALGPLLQNVTGSTSDVNANSPDRTRRYPVDLLIKLNGQLTAPDVSFDLKVKEYPASSDFRQAVTAFENRLQSNEQELTRQVSSVLVFNQLLPEGTGFFDPNSVNSGVANSVSEIISNRISQLASNLDQNLDVGISLGGLGLNNLNDNLINNLQLRFSYRFLNDRFRISRDGGFTYGQNQTSTASLLGEWTLEYMLTHDGRLRAKMYNRNQQSALGQYTFGSNTTLTTSGGISLLYTRSFNRLLGSDAPRPTPGIRQPTTIPLKPVTLTQTEGK